MTYMLILNFSLKLVEEIILNIQELEEELQLERTSGEWRLFISSSKVTLKAVLPCSGNNFPAVPLAHAFHTQ